MPNRSPDDNVRDFIYLDTDRLRSILAQVEKGLTEQSARTEGSSKSGSLGVEASVPLLAKLGGAGQYVTESQSTETKTLHDHIYNYVERRLSERGQLLVINDELGETDWLSDHARSRIRPTAFALVRGSAIVNDYAHMNDFLTNFNKIAGAVGRLPKYAQAQALPKNQGKMLLDQAAKALQLPKEQVDDLDVVLKAFVRVAVVVRIMPFANQPDARVAADLDNTGALRMPLESLAYRFGSAPRGEWTLFGQVASIPQSTDEPYQFAGSMGAEIDRALQGVFNVMRTLEPMIGSVVYPELAMIPIALYRE